MRASCAATALAAASWRAPAGGPEPPGRIRLEHLRGPIELAPVAAGRAAVGLDAPAFVGDAAAFADSWYALSVEQLRQLGESPPPAVMLLGAEDARTYQAWRARKKPMTEFIKAVGL
jgi:hypothetical protein